MLPDDRRPLTFPCSPASRGSASCHRPRRPALGLVPALAASAIALAPPCNGQQVHAPIEASLSAPAPSAQDGQGSSVAIRADWAATGTVDGEVHLFRRSTQGWSHDASLAPPAGAPGFGAALTLSDSRLFVGAPGDLLGGGAGQVFVYVHTGGVWSPETVLGAPAPTPGDRFGAALAYAPGRVLVGTPESDTVDLDAGEVHQFEWNGASWVWGSSHAAPDAAAGDLFGAALAALDTGSGPQSFVAGAPGRQAGRGAAYGFLFGLGPWAVYTLEVTGAQPGDAYGSAVGFTGGFFGHFAAVGGPGASGGDGRVEVFKSFSSTPGWTQTLAFSGLTGFGSALALSIEPGSYVLSAGIPLDSAGDGGVLVYKSDDTITFGPGEWIHGASGDELGRAVAMDDKRLIAGAPLRGASDAGGADVHRIVVSPQGLLVCLAATNSTGERAHLGFHGSFGLGANSLELLAGNVPTQPGIFFFGLNTPGPPVPFGDGLLCLTPPLHRLPVEFAVGHVLSHELDFTVQPGLQIGPGFVWFQAWFRDPAAGGLGFNLSDAYRVSVFL